MIKLYYKNSSTYIWCFFFFSFSFFLSSLHPYFSFSRKKCRQTSFVYNLYLFNWHCGSGTGGVQAKIARAFSIAEKRVNFSNLVCAFCSEFMFSFILFFLSRKCTQIKIEEPNSFHCFCWCCCCVCRFSKVDLTMCVLSMCGHFYSFLLVEKNIDTFQEEEEKMKKKKRKKWQQTHTSTH